MKKPPETINTDPIKTQPPKKPRRLSLRQEKFCQTYVRNGGNGTQAVLETYDANPNTARMMATENLAKPNIENRISFLLDKSGLSLERLNKDLTVVKDSAMRPVVVDGVIEDYPDTPTRLDAIKTAYKLHGVLEKNSESNTLNAQININNLDSSTMNRMLDCMDRLTQKMGFLVEDGEVVSNTTMPQNQPETGQGSTIGQELIDGT